ncbi:MAG: energy transducer TonB [Bacteroidaceae bacterium]|nr:energy transducer TonB [Bacteroidaceae bacterium]
MKNILLIKSTKIFLLLILLICICISASAQTSIALLGATKPVYQSVDALYLNEMRVKTSYKAPSLLDIDADSLSSYIARNYRYPYELIGDSISSRCGIKFDVDSTGCVTNIKSLSLSRNIPELAEEAQRVIKTLKFSGCPQRYDSIANCWKPDTLGLTVLFFIVPYPVECINNKDIIIEELAKINSYQYFGNNGWGSTPVGWVLQQRLKAVTSAQEKKELFLTQTNPVVRFTAFNGLLEIDDTDCVAFVKKSIADSSSIMCWSCDVGFYETLADAVISQLFRNKDAFTKADSLDIDSLVLYSSNMYAYDYKRIMFHRMEPTPERYARIKELCQNKQESSALCLLAKYKREEDKQLFIKALGEYGMGLDKEGAYKGKYSGRADAALEAIISWPDKSFIPVLKKLGDYELTRKYHGYKRIEDFYTVIMEYDNDWAYKYLEEYFGKKEAGKVYSHPENLYRAYYLNEHPHERFLPIVEKYAKQPWDWEYIKKNK